MFLLCDYITWTRLSLTVGLLFTLWLIVRPCKVIDPKWIQLHRFVDLQVINAYTLMGFHCLHYYEGRYLIRNTHPTILQDLINLPQVLQQVYRCFVKSCIVESWKKNGMMKSNDGLPFLQLVGMCTVLRSSDVSSLEVPMKSNVRHVRASCKLPPTRECYKIKE